jgi:hypothetical protein
MNRRPPTPHAQIHLPPLSAGYALTLVDILGRITEAIWRAPGDKMSELRRLRERASGSDFVNDGDPEAPDDVDF